MSGCQSAARIVVIAGTRPEALKLAPVIRALRSESAVQVQFLTTAQHRSLLDLALARFDLQPDQDLDLMEPGQTSPEFMGRALPAVARALRTFGADMVLVQGDTNSAVVGALAGFHEMIPVGHVEAGLRSRDMANPFPEEANRRVISQLATLHFAATIANRDNLVEEGVDSSRIAVTGNPIVDALHSVLEGLGEADSVKEDRLAVDSPRRILVTLHRRETIGQALAELCEAIRDLVVAHPDVSVVWPVHPNPAVRATVYDRCGDTDRIRLIEPVGYLEFIRFMRAADLIISDSGGVQEEAPTVGTPLLVVRDVTERPEVIECGAARLIGRNPGRLFSEASALLGDSTALEAMQNKENPFGDGHAAGRIRDATLAYLGLIR